MNFLGLSERQVQMILGGDVFIEIGNPLKDIMDQGDIENLVQAVAKELRRQGHRLEVDDE